MSQNRYSYMPCTMTSIGCGPGENGNLIAQLEELKEQQTFVTNSAGATHGLLAVNNGYVKNIFHVQPELWQMSNFVRENAKRLETI